MISTQTVGNCEVHMCARETHCFGGDKRRESKSYSRKHNKVSFSLLRIITLHGTMFVHFITELCMCVKYKNKAATSST